MTQIVKIAQSKRYVAGLTWRALADSSASGEINKILKEEGAEHGAVLSNDGGAAVGVIKRSSWDSRFSGQISLASAAAERISDGIVVLPIRAEGGRNLEQWWMCSISHGVVRSGSDIIQKREVIKQRVAADLELLEGYQIFVPAELRDDFQGLTTQDIADYIDFDEFDGGVKVGPLKSTGLSGYLGLILVLAALGVGGYFGWEMMKPKPPPPLVPEGVDPSVIVKTELEKFRGVTLETMGILLPKPGGLWIREVRAHLWKLPRDVHGFEWTSARCTPDGSCDLEWRTVGKFSIPAFQDRFASIAVGDITFPMDGNGAKFSIKVPVSDVDVSGRDEAWIDGIPHYKDFIREYAHRINALESIRPEGWSSSGREVAPVSGLTHPTLPPAPVEIPTWFNRKLQQGGVTVTITRLWLLDPVLDLLESPYINWNRMSMTVNGPAPTLNLEATYVVHSTNAP